MLATSLVATALLIPSTPAVAAPARKISYSEWDSAAALRAGSLRGAEVRRGRVVIAEKAAGIRTIAGRRYETGRWTSPWRSAGFGLSELVPSWDAKTPGRSLVEISVRGRTESGRRASWDVVAQWASGDKYLRRSSVGGQGDDLADVNVDTWQVGAAAGLATYQVRVTLFRLPGGRGASLDSAGAVASRLSDVGDVARSKPRNGLGVRLAVPRYSQMIHDGHYPRYGGGGLVWCSPTSTSMVLGYYDALPRPRAYSWVPAGHANPWVDNTARATYDKRYGGTGNWAFNTAYAATRTGNAFVTRMRNLNEAGLFIAAGIPVVATDRVRQRPARRRPHLLDRRAPGGHRRLHRRRRRDRQRPGRSPEPRRAPYLRPGAVRGRLGRPQEGDGVRDHRRRPPAPEGGARELVNAQNTG